MDCMLSEERIAALVRAINDAPRAGLTTEQVIGRFFAMPPGSVRVEIAVCVSGDGKECSAAVVDGNRELAMSDARDCMWADPVYECYATLYVPPVPQTPVVEVVS